MEPSRSRGSLGPLALLGAALVLSVASCHRIANTDVYNAVIPHADGTACNADVQCASNSCQGGVCAAVASGLVEIDGDCSGGETCVPDATCDTGICVETSAACGADHTPCLADADCCAQTCTSGKCGYSGSCSGEGVACSSGSDCCSGSCSGGACGTGSSCGSQGAQCFGDSECCSNYCDTSTDSCSTCSLAAKGDSCSVDSDCCSGFCTSGAMTCL